MNLRIIHKKIIYSEINSEYKSLQPGYICFQNKTFFYEFIPKLFGKFKNKIKKYIFNSEILNAWEEKEIKYYKLQNNWKTNEIIL